MDYPLHYLHCYHFQSLEHVWVEIIQLKSSHNLEWKLKGFLEAIRQNPLDGMSSQKRGLAA